MKLALIQTPYQSAQNVQEHFREIMVLVEEACQKKADLIVLPELFIMALTDRKWDEPRVGKELNQWARDGIFKKIISLIEQKAREKQTTIVAGTVPCVKDVSIMNRCHVFGPRGLIETYDKQVLTPDEKIYGWKTGCQLKPFVMNGIRIMPLVCYDVESPRISEKLARQDFDLLLIPSMTSPKGFYRVHLCARTRAIEHHCYAAVTGIFDTDQEIQEYRSQPAVYSPSSEMFHHEWAIGLVNTTQIFMADIDFELLRASKKSTGYYPGRDDQHLRTDYHTN